MVFIIGLMFKVTAPFASAFIALKHNITDLQDQSISPILYTYGYKDLGLVFFYTLIAIVVHAVIQEYVLDKLIRKVRLSKTKTNKFNESGQLLSFYAISAACAVVIFKDEGYFRSLNFFWTDYPHVGLTFLTKFFFIFQISYWLHQYPELYLQKVKKEEILSKVLVASVNLLLCAAIYCLNLTRIGLTFLFLEYAISVLFHFSRILYFFNKTQISNIGFRAYNVLFVLTRPAVIVLSVFVFWFGLENSSVDSINLDEGNFNTPLVRISALSVIIVLQVWMLWNFILFHFKKKRENAQPIASCKNVRPTQKKAKTIREESGESDGDLATNGDVKSKTN